MVNHCLFVIKPLYPRDPLQCDFDFVTREFELRLFLRIGYYMFDMSAAISTHRVRALCAVARPERIDGVPFNGKCFTRNRCDGE